MAFSFSSVADHSCGQFYRSRSARIVRLAMERRKAHTIPDGGWREDFERGAEACLSGTVSSYHGELSVLVPDPPSIELNVRMRAFDGRQRLHVIVLSADVRSDRTRLEAELKQARLAASIVAASSDAIFSASTEGLIFSRNYGARRSMAIRPRK